QRNELETAAAFLGLAASPFIGEEMLERSQQEGAEFALFWIDGPKVILLQQPSEEFLGQILGFVGLIAASANESVQGVPIRAAQVFQRRIDLGRTALARSQHDCPMSRREGNPLVMSGSFIHALKHEPDAGKRQSWSMEWWSGGPLLHHPTTLGFSART